MPTDGLLATLADLKDELEIKDAITSRDAVLTFLLKRASGIVAAASNRSAPIYSGTPATGFFSIMETMAWVWTRNYPILSSPAAQVYEDSNRAYGASTLLVDGTDYMVERRSGKITRISGSFPIPWAYGLRAVKVVYAAGFDDSSNDKANIPLVLRDATLRFAAIGYREIQSQLQGLVMRTEESGAVFKALSRSLTTTHLSEEMLDQIASEVRDEYGGFGEESG